MSNINKLQIKEYEINQSFYHDYNTVGPDNGIYVFDTNLFRDTGKTFIEYVLIVIHTEENLENSELLIILDGTDIASKRKFIHHNKLYPLEYEKSYDDETNMLLSNMVRTNIPNVLFMPLNIATGSILSIRIFKIMQTANVDFYFKLSDEARQIHIPDIQNTEYILDVPYKSELIQQYCSGVPGYGKKSTVEFTHNGNFMTNLYLELIQEPDKYHIKNYYKLYKKISIEFGGRVISEIPLDYIILYLKYVKNIQIENMSNDKHHIIPINLKELINLSEIIFHNFYGVKMYLHPNDISKFHYDTKRNIKCDNIDLAYTTFLNYIPTELWGVILEYCNCRDLLCVAETCKFFYSLVPQKKIDELYNACKITVNDLSMSDAEIDVMYYLSKNPDLKKYRPYDNLNFNKLNKFPFDAKHIFQYEIIVAGDEYLLEMHMCSPIEYMIIDFDIAGKYDILDMLNTKYGDGIIADADFYSKMHNPQCNRYVLYCNINIDKINLVFKEFVNTKANVYIAYNHGTTIGR